MKLRKRILSAVLAAAMILPLAFAAPQTARAEESAPEAEVEEVLEALEEAPALEAGAAAVNYNYRVDQIAAKYRGQTQTNYTSSIAPGSATSSTVYVMIPVKVRGGTYFTFETAGENNATNISSARIFKDEDLTDEIVAFSEDYQFGSAFKDYGTSKIYSVPVEGTQSDYYVYYIVLGVFLYDKAAGGPVHYRASYYMPGKAMPAKTWVYASNMGSPKKSYYYKFTLKNDGYVDLTFDNMGTGNDAFKYQICKKASAASDYAYSKGWETYDKTYGNILGLKKGTYYLRVMTADDTFALKYVFSAREVTTNTAASKATVIKKGDSVNTLIPLTQGATTSAFRWYKFTTTGNCTIGMDYKAFLDFGGSKTCGLKFMLYKGSPSKKVTVPFGSKDYSTCTSTGQTNGHFTFTLGKGTYYLRVATTGKANGWFKLQYKTLK